MNLKSRLDKLENLVDKIQPFLDFHRRVKAMDLGETTLDELRSNSNLSGRAQVALARAKVLSLEGIIGKGISGELPNIPGIGDKTYRSVICALEEYIYGKEVEAKYYLAELKERINNAELELAKSKDLYRAAYDAYWAEMYY